MVMGHIVLAVNLFFLLKECSGAVLEGTNTQSVQPASFPGQYIVEMKTSLTDSEALSVYDSMKVDASMYGCNPSTQREIYNEKTASLQTFTRLYFIECMDERYIKEIEKNTNVVSVNPNIVIQGLAEQCNNIDASQNWGLDRIDQAGPMNSLYKAEYDELLGCDSVDVYVLDTGIFDQHPAFATYNNIDSLYDVVTQESNAYDFTWNSHGTAIAGLIGGEFGAAPGARIHAIKIFDEWGYGTFATLIAGLNRAHDMIVASGRKSIVNLSIGAPNAQNSNLENIVAKLITEANAAVTIAAGNWGNLACHNTPARVPEALTAAASNVTDKLWPDSSYGSCVDIVGPGVNVLVPCYYGGLTYCYKNGSSIATALASGAMAGYWHVNPDKTNIEVMDWVISGATNDIFDETTLLGTPNKFLKTRGCPN
ncbi:unnamed protein product [Owenia fusiformis]|uniref:Peptidase S8/S53 domain-containing protein n=1 Tax=Owenia fusiformis TaxID=6347 RepID=A0A8S4N4L2_OWEFU|nr:unnamed protein product [Owenia fusiformis]